MPRPLEASDEGDELVLARDRGERGEVGLQRLGTAGLDALLVHERRPQVTDLLRRAPRLGALGGRALLDDRAHLLLRDHGELGAGAPGGAVRGDLLGGQPAGRSRGRTGRPGGGRRGPSRRARRRASSCGQPTQLPRRREALARSAVSRSARGSMPRLTQTLVVHHADLLVEAEGAGAGVRRQLGDRGAVRAADLERVDEQRAGQSPVPLVPADGELADEGALARRSDRGRHPRPCRPGRPRRGGATARSPGRRIGRRLPVLEASAGRAPTTRGRRPRSTSFTARYSAGSAARTT